jgi:hypothetical protein
MPTMGTVGTAAVALVLVGALIFWRVAIGAFVKRAAQPCLSFPVSVVCDYWATLQVLMFCVFELNISQISWNNQNMPNLLLCECATPTKSGK